MNKSANIQ